MKRRWIVPLLLVLPAAAVAALLAANVLRPPLVQINVDAAVLAVFALLLAALLATGIALAYRHGDRVALRRRQAVEQARREAAADHRRFLQRLDHELKNPLTAIRAGVANLADAPGEGRSEILSSVSAQTVRLSRLLADLRKLAELETRPLERAPVDIAELLREVSSQAEDRPDAPRRRVALTLPQAPWPLPPVIGDRDPCQVAAQLKQQGVDLVVNTVGFQVDDTARAQLECIAQATGGEYRDVQNAGDLGEQLKQVAIPPLPVGTAEIGGLTFESAPVVQPGLYSTTLMQGETRFFAVEVADGQRLLASGSLIGQPDAVELYSGSSYSTEVLFTVYDFQRAPAKLEDGRAELSSNEQYQAAVGATFGVATGIAGEDTLQSGRYYVALSLRDNERQLEGREFPAEIGIGLEGVGAPAAQAPAAPGPNAGGLSFDAAPLVQTGSYSGSIKAGETRFYAIDVAQGQRLRASATLLGQPELQDAYEGKSSYALTVSFAVYNPQRAQVDLPEGVVSERNPQYAGTSNESFGAEVGPIGSGKLESGRYYIALRLRDNDNVSTGREFRTEYGFELLGP